ncbi:MAG: hypothetical protein QW728_07450 [Thermoplasmata archaeon]
MIVEQREIVVTLSSMQSKVLHINRDTRGSIEGLPLHLLILIVIAAVGLAIIIAWFATTDDLDEIGNVYAVMGTKIIKAIQVAGTNYPNEEGRFEMDALEIRVNDKDENALPGAMVTIEGCNLRGSLPTNEDGGAKFGSTEVLICVLSIGQQEGKVTVSATKTGYSGKVIQIPVVRGDSGGFIYNQ